VTPRATFRAIAIGLVVAPTALADKVPHPEPRVIVNVAEVRGPHPAAAVQRAARFGWGRIVRCYKTIDRQAKGTVMVQAVVSGMGSVTRSRQQSSTLGNAELSACLVDCLKGLPMPKADAASTARIEIQVAPGDPP
jgi:hypothetical protein